VKWPWNGFRATWKRLPNGESSAFFGLETATAMSSYTMLLVTRIVLLLGVFAVPFARAQNLSGSAEADVRESLTKLESVWNDAHVRGNAAVLDALWTEDLTVIVPGMPIFNKASGFGAPVG